MVLCSDKPQSRRAGIPSEDASSVSSGGAGVLGSNVRGVTVSSHDFEHLQPQSVILVGTSLPSPGFYDSREACSFEEKSHCCSTGHITAFLPYLPALPRLTSQEPGALQGFLSTTRNNFLKIGSDIPQIRRHHQGEPLLKYRCSRSLHLDGLACVEGTENLPCCSVRGQVMSPCGHIQGCGKQRQERKAVSGLTPPEAVRLAC